MNEELLRKIEQLKVVGKKVGLVQGSWDLFHLGHLKYLKKAKEQCDFLVVAMDSDEKIQKRKGNSRPIIPEEERKEFISLLGIADAIVIKPVGEPKWNLIKTIKPDVLVAIKENYTEEEIKKLESICGKVAILPRQSESSTSDKIRKITIAQEKEKAQKNQKQYQIADKLKVAIEETKKRIGLDGNMEMPISGLIDYLSDSTDWKCPVSACCFHNGSWYYGANHTDFDISNYDIINRSELYYQTVEHAEINLLKKLGEVEKLDTPIYTTLFPCDKCMKVLIDKGVKEIYYLEDHPDKNWSKRSHALANKKGIKTVNMLEMAKDKTNETKIETDMNSFKYIYPPNARYQEQLDIMMNLENQDKDPLAPEYIDQPILYFTNYWYVSQNRFPYEGVEAQFLIVAKNPIYKKEDMPVEMWAELQKIWDDLTKDYSLNGGALCFRFGDQGLSGASLKRLHAHLIIPKENTKVKFSMGGRRELKEGLVLGKKKD